MTHKTKRRIASLFIVILVIGALIFIAKPYLYANDDQNTPSAQQAQQAMPVSVMIAQKQATQIWKTYSARLEAVGYAEIQPQVSGRITAINFSDGQIVEKGDVIYIIDPRPYEAILAQAEANLNAVKNKADLALKEYNRAKGLIKENAISQRILEERQSASSIAQSAIQGAIADVEQAKINVDYAYVKAPISGKTSRAEVKIGNVVQANGNAPILTSIVSTDGIYADFEVDEKTFASIATSKTNNIPVQLYVTNKETPYLGVVDSFDNRIDPTSGTIRARALFKNEDSALLPGMFATIKMGQAQIDQIFTVPESIIGTDQTRRYVYVVNDQNVVERRTVTLGASTDGNRIITDGIHEGDKIINEGLIRIRPGMPVTPQVTNHQES